jgi:hypothetical protein
MTDQEAMDHPINRRARQHLQALNQKPEAYHPTWVGLAMWARDTLPEAKELNDRYRQEHQYQALLWLLSLGPAAALEWGNKSLLEEADGQALNPFLEEPNPRPAAWLLLELLQDQMSEFQEELPDWT